MVDKLSQERRAWNMRQVHSRNTNPEIIVRRLLHKMGFRFRLHKKSLPGSPDIVLAKYKTVVFVHGCFWHRHIDCSDASLPKTRTDFWQSKFAENIARDTRNQAALISQSWKICVIWECETKDLEKLSARLAQEIVVPEKI